MSARMPFAVEWRTGSTEEVAAELIAARLRRVKHRVLLPDVLWGFRYEGGALIPVEARVRGKRPAGAP